MLPERNRLARLGVSMLFVTAVFMAVNATHYVTGLLNNFNQLLPGTTKFMAIKGALAHDPAWMTFFRLHIIFGAIGIVLGAWQFFPSFRSRFKLLHRIAGSGYAGAILISSAAGLYLCWFASVSLIGVTGFYITNLLWLGSTVLAIKAVLNKNIAVHQKWFIRSYAFTLVVVSFRLFYQLLFGILGYDFDHAYILSIWLSVPFNMIIAERIIRKIPANHRLRTTGISQQVPT